jgi:hypothetical protein
LFRKSLQELNAIDTGDGSKLPLEEIYGILFQRIHLNLLVGQAEDAYDIVRLIEDRLQQQMQDRQATDFDDVRFQPIRSYYRKQMLDTMLVLGRFNEAAKILNSQINEIRTGLEEMKNSPALLQIPIKKQVVSIGFRGIVPLWIGRLLSNRPGAEFAGLFDLTFQEQMFQQRVSQYLNLFRTLEDRHFQLGMLLIEQGNNAAAAAQFREVGRSSTPRFQTQLQRTAQMYLNLLNRK